MKPNTINPDLGDSDFIFLARLHCCKSIRNTAVGAWLDEALLRLSRLRIGKDGGLIMTSRMYEKMVLEAEKIAGIINDPELRFVAFDKIFQRLLDDHCRKRELRNKARARNKADEGRKKGK